MSALPGDDAFFARFPDYLRYAIEEAPGLARRLEGTDLDIRSREVLARLPVLRKDELMEAQAAQPPFGGFVAAKWLPGARVFLSPGPVWEVEGDGDFWNARAAVEAAGMGRGTRVLNTLAYGPTPGGFILDGGARAAECTVLPAGAGGTDMTVEAMRTFRPAGYLGTPDYLGQLMDRADAAGVEPTFTHALVSGGALFPATRESYRARGVQTMQCYATADLGVIAYETDPDGASGMRVSDGILVEIVRPGTDDPVPFGEVGEVVVTRLEPVYPLVRFGTGDLSAFMEGEGLRLKGWMGRADQRTKVKGMFVDPKQIARVAAAWGLDATRLVVTHEDGQDRMELLYRGEAEPDAVADALRSETGLRGTARAVDELPNDGKVIADEREYGE